MNFIHKYLEFKLTKEGKNITYLDLFIHRNNNDLHLGIHRKPTQTDTTIHFASNTLLEQTCYIQLLHKQNDNTANHEISKKLEYYLHRN